MIIDGKKAGHAIQEYIKTLLPQLGEQPGLAVVLVGDNPASQVYVNNKVKTAQNLGFQSKVIRLPYNISQTELLKCIDELNKDKTICGILVQLPLPSHIESRLITQTIDPNKDVDGFHPYNVGLLWEDTSYSINSGLVPCTPFGCLALIKHVEPHLSGKSALIVGRSNIVGKPMLALLLNENITPTIAHSKTHALKTLGRNADIVVAAIGKAKFLNHDYFHADSIVIDVGINRTETGQLVGDVDFQNSKDIVRAITPVPGGVGPMTIACLMRNTMLSSATLQGNTHIIEALSLSSLLNILNTQEILHD